MSKFTRSFLVNTDPSFGVLKVPDIIKEANQDVANIALFTQSVTLPELDLDFSTIGTQFADLNIATGKLHFADLNTTIMNDENWFMYRFFCYWLIAGHNPEEYNKRNSSQDWKDFYISAYLIILDNDRNKILEIKFNELHPKTIGSVDLKNSAPDKIILPITWKYTDWYFTDDMVIKRV